MMEHSKLVHFLHDELSKLGFNNLDKFDILKHATIVRDPVTKESVIPFETRPTKSCEMKTLAWEKIHQEAQSHFMENNLKSRDISNDTLIQNNIIRNNTEKKYDISRDKDYMKINFNESSALIYNYIKEKATSTFRQLNHSRHAVVQNTKISKNGKTAKVIDLLDSGGDMNLVTEEIKTLIDVTEVRNETFNVVTSAGVGLQTRDKVGYEIQRCNGDPKGITAHLTDTLGTANGFDAQSTKCITEGFGMDSELSDYFLGKLHYNAAPISGIMA